MFNNNKNLFSNLCSSSHTIEYEEITSLDTVWILMVMLQAKDTPKYNL